MDAIQQTVSGPKGLVTCGTSVKGFVATDVPSEGSRTCRIGLLMYEPEDAECKMLPQELSVMFKDVCSARALAELVRCYRTRARQETIVGGVVQYLVERVHDRMPQLEEARMSGS